MPSATIPAIDFDQHPGDFDRLRSQAITLVQQLCGQHWTDFNPHDPGVTIIEQLCYALTDLQQAASYPQVDYLAADGGGLDLTELVLPPPEEALVCRPATLSDYRSQLLDLVNSPEQSYGQVVDNIWVSLVADDRPLTGRYQVNIQLSEAEHYRNRCIIEDLERRIRIAWQQMRNLGEMLEKVCFLTPQHWTLQGQIELEEGASVDRVVAEIYVCCADWLEQPAQLHRFDESGDPPPADQLFDGPARAYGRYQRLDKHKVPTLLSALRQSIDRLHGVARVDQLQLVNWEGETVSVELRRPADQILLLALPETQNALSAQLHLHTQGQRHQPVLKSVQGNIKRLRLRQGQQFGSPVDFSCLYPRPEPADRHLDQYTSVQSHFPACYRVHETLKPLNTGDAGAREQAAVAQLKGYLLLFDQLMANFRTGLAQRHRLFSLDRCDQPDAVMPATLAFHQLDELQVEGIGQLYPEQPTRRFEALLAGAELGMERKQKLFDYLLALHGERLDSRPLLIHRGGYDRQTLARMLFRQQAQYLRNIVHLTRDRCAGADLSTGLWLQAHVSAFQQRARARLGFQPLSQQPDYPIEGWTQSSDSVFNLAGIEVGADRLLFTQCSQAPTRHQHYLEHSDLTAQANWLPVIRAELSSRYSVIDLASLLPLQPQDSERPLAIPQSLLSQGAELKRYRLVRQGVTQQCELVVELELQTSSGAEGGTRWLFLGHFDNEQAAALRANQLSSLFLQLNLASEQLHIVEHLLLRTEHTDEEQDTACESRISLVLTGWTGRCRDQGFRRYAEQQLRQLCPAHLYPQFFWLEYGRMQAFERHYRDWLSAQQSAFVSGQANRELIEQSAASLRALLKPSEEGGLQR